jgi:hypothetical protein
MAKRCSSPPERRSISRSQTTSSSSFALVGVDNMLKMTLVAHTECLSDLLQSFLANIASCSDQVADRSVVLLLERLGNLIDILGLSDSLKVILENLCEVVCKFLSACIPEVSKSCIFLLCNSEPRKYLRISSQSGGSSKRPRLGFSLPARILRAVLLPIPLVPTRPRTWPGLGMGRRCSLKLLAE